MSHRLPPRLLAGAVALLAMTSSTTAQFKNPWKVGEPLPGLTLPRIDAGDGFTPVSLADFRGKRLLLIEFASW